jgi:hypothetical protein
MVHDHDDTYYDDDIAYVGSKLPRGHILLAHKRRDCEVYRNFGRFDDDIHFCPSCYCEICEVKASECGDWPIHCHGKSPNANAGQIAPRGTQTVPLEFPHAYLPAVRRNTAPKARQQPGNKLLGFGKYSDKTYAWVEQHNHGYSQWCVNTVSRSHRVCPGLRRFAQWLRRKGYVAQC